MRIPWRIKSFISNQRATIHPAPVIVYGNQKSGTSAIAGLLGKATGLPVTIDVFCFSDAGVHTDVFQRSVSLKHYIQTSRVRFSNPIIKDPDFTFLVPELSSLFPNSKSVFVVRNPFQNIRSILNRLKLSGKETDLSASQWKELSDKHPLWFQVLDGELFGHSGTNYIHTLAKRWNLCVQTYLDNKELMSLVVYELFTADKVGAIQDLASQLDLPVLHDITEIQDLSFQPAGTPCSAESFFSDVNLEMIRDVCSPLMDQLSEATGLHLEDLGYL